MSRSKRSLCIGLTKRFMPVYNLKNILRRVTNESFTFNERTSEDVIKFRIDENGVQNTQKWFVITALLIGAEHFNKHLVFVGSDKGFHLLQRTDGYWVWTDVIHYFSFYDLPIWAIPVGLRAHPWLLPERWWLYVPVMQRSLVLIQNFERWHRRMTSHLVPFWICAFWTQTHRSAYLMLTAMSCYPTHPIAVDVCG